MELSSFVTVSPEILCFLIMLSKKEDSELVFCFFNFTFPLHSRSGVIAALANKA